MKYPSLPEELEATEKLHPAGCLKIRKLPSHRFNQKKQESALEQSLEANKTNETDHSEQTVLFQACQIFHASSKPAASVGSLAIGVRQLQSVTR